jgi:PAT family beta-lactamase induction signal transducer AmpG
MDPVSQPPAHKTEPSKEGNPWLYLPTLYLPFGILMALVTSFPGTFFKLLGYSNETVGLLNGIGLIGAFRFLYAPYLDGAASKRVLSLYTVGIACFFITCMSLLVFFSESDLNFFFIMLGLLVFLAFVASSHETAADGFYIRALKAERQAEFIGIKTAANRIGSLSVVMGLLLLATKIAASHGATGVDSVDKTGFHLGFGTAYAIGASLMAFFLVWNWKTLPKLAIDQPVRHNRFAIAEVLREYLAQRKVVVIVMFILLYRFGEGFLLLKGPFYLDPIEVGGLGVKATALPYYVLLTDIPWAVTGGILGGYLIKWFGLIRTLIPLVLCMSLPNLAYVAVAWLQPQVTFSLLGEALNPWLIVASSIESLGYGLSFSAMFYYMHIIATEAGRNKTSILAISFALMNVGFLLPGMMSGFVQAQIGYVGLFIASSTIGLLVLFLIPILPMAQSEEARRKPLA